MLLPPAIRPRRVLGPKQDGSLWILPSEKKRTTGEKHGHSVPTPEGGSRQRAPSRHRAAPGWASGSALCPLPSPSQGINTILAPHFPASITIQLPISF